MKGMPSLIGHAGTTFRNPTWNGNNSTFAMNGQTGNFVGDLPIDKGAYWKYFGGIFAAGSIIAYAVELLLFH